MNLMEGQTFEEPLAELFGEEAIKLEAIASRLEAIASRLEAIALRLEAIALRLSENLPSYEEPLAELSEEEKSFLVCAAAVVLLALGACLRATSHHWSHVSTFCKKNFLNLINRPQNEESRWERRSLYMQVCLQKVILAEIYWRYSACWLIFLTLTRASRILTKDPVWISSFAAWGWVLLAFLIIVWTQVPCATQTWSLDFVCILWYLATGFYLSSWVIPVEQLLLMEFVLFVLVALPLCTFAKHYSVVFLCQGGLMAFVVACAVLEDLPRKRFPGEIRTFAK